MPFGADAFVNVQEAIKQNLFDLLQRQAILNVRVDRGASALRLRFDTVWPSYATVEIFHMAHGEISLDMEKENLFRTEIELFGDARLQHDATVRNLDQERRYWFRISVPRRTEAEPTASGKVRAR